MSTGPQIEISPPIGRDETASEPTDAELLESFIRTRDSESFESLVVRHAPMVFGVCRRILGNRHDAEDAFQAAFLVLARKAPTVRPHAPLANWLYGVACRTSLQAKTVRDRNTRRERSMSALPEVPAESARSNEWLGLLDEELSQLPEMYRVPLVLCELEGLSYREAAAEMGLTEKAISVRLVRARKLLAARLARYATVPTAGVVALAFSPNTASAAVPAALVSATALAAPHWAVGAAIPAGLVSPQVAALAQSVLLRMLLSRILLGAAIVFAATIGVAAAALMIRPPRAAIPSLASSPQPQFIGNATVASRVPSPTESLAGSWRAVAAEVEGSPVPPGELRAAQIRLAIDGEHVVLRNVESQDGEAARGTIRHGAPDHPAQVDLVFPLTNGSHHTALGICAREGNTLRLCFGQERPTDFRTHAGRDDLRLFVFERE